MIQMLTPFRADQYVAEGGAALGAGIGGGLANLGDALAKALEAKKRKGQLATSMRKTLSVAYPDRKDEFDTMGLPDLQGALEGEALKSGLAKAKRQAQAEDLQTAIQGMRMKQMLGEQAKPQALLEALEAQAQPGQYPPTAEGFDQAVNEQSGLSPAGMGLLRSSAQLKVPLPASIEDDLIRSRPAPATPPVPQGMETSSITYDAYGRPTTTYRRPKDDPEKEPIISIGVGAPNLMGDYPNKLRITPSQLKKHREALAELGFNLPSSESEQPPKIPTVGSVEGGFRFKGGNPADPKNWEKVK